MFLLLIQQAVFDRDPDIARDRAQDFNVFRRKQGAVGRTAQADNGHHPPARYAGNIVVQRAADVAGRHHFQIVSADYSGDRGARSDHVPKIARHFQRLRESGGARDAITTRTVFVFDKDRYPLDVHYLSQPRDQRIQQRIKPGRGRKRAAKIQKAATQVVTLTIEKSIDSLLQKILNRRSDHHDDSQRSHRENQAQGDFSGGRDPSVQRIQAGKIYDCANA